MNHTHHTSYCSLFFIFLLALVPFLYVFIQARDTIAIYDKVLSEPPYAAVKVATLENTSTTISVPNWKLFTPNNIWMLASFSHPLPTSYEAPPVIVTSTPHASDADKVSSVIEPYLIALSKAAKADGIDLMLSSAYRSVADQQALYNDFVTTKGKAMADLYVAKPGTSEHHTGLAIDFADSSPKCQDDSNTCNLSGEAASWLANNAYKYGFVLRYPEGKKPITGIAYEPWHYRFVGLPLASAMQDSSMTLDEVLAQLYPAFTK